MNSKKIFSICLLIAINFIDSIYGCCDTIVPIVNFNISRFSGAWYNYQIDRKQDVRNCLRSTFKLTNNSYEYSLIQNYKGSNGTMLSLMRTLKIDENGLGFWQSNDPNEPRLTIIATDYENYAVGAVCLNRFGSNVHVLVRNFDKVNFNASMGISVALDNINFNPNYLAKTPFDSATCKASTNKLIRTYFMFVLIIMLIFILYF